MTAAYVYLFLAFLGATTTLTAVLRQRGSKRLGVMYSVMVFFIAAPIAELPLHNIVMSVLVSGMFIENGVMGYWPGRLGLGLATVSVSLLWWLYHRGGNTRAEVERGLQEGLGQHWTDEIDPRFSATLKTSAPLRSWARPFKWHDRINVERIRNLSYGPAGVRNRLDVYRPRSGAKGAPVLLQIHGGAWTYGNKDTQGLPLMNEMVRQGWVCVAINYRLSPRATWPDHLMDCKLALKWIRENIADYGGDPDFVVSTGGSAGAHLTTMLAITANDPKYQPGFEQVDTRLAAAVPMYGLYDLLDYNGRIFETKEDAGFVGRYVMKEGPDENRARWVSASPIRLPLGDVPPFFIMHGTHDALVWVENCRKFVARLRQASSQPVAYAELTGARHAFDVLKSRRCVHAVNGVAAYLAWLRSTRHERR